MDACGGGCEEMVYLSTLQTMLVPRHTNQAYRMSQVSQIQSKGIYRGLPTFPDTHEGYTAVVAGANGISGHHMVGDT